MTTAGLWLLYAISIVLIGFGARLLVGNCVDAYIRLSGKTPGPGPIPLLGSLFVLVGMLILPASRRIALPVFVLTLLLTLPYLFLKNWRERGKDAGTGSE